MKKIALALMALALMAGVACADEGGAVGGGILGAISKTASTVLQVGHGALHVAQSIVDAGMKVAHAGLDALGIPFSDKN